MTYSWLIGVLLTSLCGCVSESKLLLHQQRKSLPLGCPVQILNKSELAGNYTVIAEIEHHVKRSIFLGGQTSAQEQTQRELRQRTCLAGANAYVIDDQVTSNAAELHHLHSWARIIDLPVSEKSKF